MNDSIRSGKRSEEREQRFKKSGSRASALLFVWVGVAGSFDAKRDRLDIGGANLKAARAENGLVVAALQIPCAPHMGLGEIETALRMARKVSGPPIRNAVTMTAELSDAFPIARAASP